MSNLALSNVGCEIIMRGTASYLSKGLGGAPVKIAFPSYHQARDAELLRDMTAVEVISMRTHKRIARGVLQKTGNFLRFWTPRFDSRHFRRADVFLSVGGDIYTMFDGDLPYDWIGHEVYASNRQIPSVMLGANMERFEVLSDSNRNLLLDHLSRFRIIAVRDRVTASYLNSFGVSRNVVVMPDPVFALRPRATFEAGPLNRIGVNFSGLAAESDANVVGAYVKLVEELLAQGKEVVLIPHVYSPDGFGTMDDRAMLRQVSRAVGNVSRNRLSVYEGQIDFESLSRCIATVDALVGVRMHACLSALTLGKPTVFLAYSGKAASMVNWLQDDSPYGEVAPCIALQDLSDLDPAAVIASLTSAEEFLRDRVRVEIDMSDDVQRAASSIADSMAR